MFKFLAGCFVFLLSNAFTAAAQDTLSRPQQADSISIVNQIHSDRLRFVKVDSVTQLQMLAGNVILQQDNTKFYCDSAVINKHLNILEAFGNVHINDADSIHTYGQYLIYHIDTKTATLKKKVKTYRWQKAYLPPKNCSTIQKQKPACITPAEKL